MSVINDMLRDLDRRGAGENLRVFVQHVRPVDKRRREPWRPVPLVAVVLVAAAFAAHSSLSRSPAAPFEPPLPLEGIAPVSTTESRPVTSAMPSEVPKAKTRTAKSIAKKKQASPRSASAAKAKAKTAERSVRNTRAATAPTMTPRATASASAAVATRDAAPLGTSAVAPAGASNAPPDPVFATLPAAMLPSVQAVKSAAAMTATSATGAPTAGAAAAAPSGAAVPTRASASAARSATAPAATLAAASAANPAATKSVAAPAATSPSAPAPSSTGTVPATDDALTDGSPRIDKKDVARPRQAADGEFKRAVTLLNQGRTEESRAALRAALTLDPRHAAARQTLAALLIDWRGFDEAESVLGEGLRLHPAQANFAIVLARLKLDRGDAAAAHAVLRDHAAAQAGNAEYRAFHATVLRRLGRNAEAIAEYQAALKIAPGTGVWWLGLGLAQEAAERPDHAADAFRRARSSGTLSPNLVAFVEQRLKAAP